MAAEAAEEPPPSAAGASSCSTSPSIHVVDTVVVQPSSLSLQDGPASREASLPLTFFDIFWLHSPPVERLLLYRLAPDADADAIISTLKASLSEALGAFYPLAGRVRLAPGTANRYELYYRPGDGVGLTVAEYDHDVDALATHDAREVARVAPLIPPLQRDSALLALQATLLSGRRGLAIGVTVHHAACDGAGSTHFLHTWAAAAMASSAAGAEMQAPPSLQPPVIDRTLIPDPRGLYDIYYQARPSTDEMEFVKMRPDQLLATFVLSTADLQRVKDTVAAEAAARGAAPPPRCSSLVATLGLVWSSYLRAKKQASGDGGEGSGPTCLLFSVDQRSRMTPPVPEKYLGNCVGPAFAVAPRDALAAPGASGLFTACAAVAAAIQDAVAEIGTPRVDAWMERLRESGKMGTLSMAGSPRFRVYELDFGFGTPAKVDIVSVARTGAVAVADSRNGDGMEVGISLPPDGMDRFRKCFGDAVAWLRTDDGAEEQRHRPANA